MTKLREDLETCNWIRDELKLGDDEQIKWAHFDSARKSITGPYLMRYFRYEGPEGLHAKLNIINNIVDTLIRGEELELGGESLLPYLEDLAGVKRPITRFEGLAASRILDASDSWIHIIEGSKRFFLYKELLRDVRVRLSTSRLAQHTPPTCLRQL